MCSALTSGAESFCAWPIAENRGRKGRGEEEGGTRTAGQSISKPCRTSARPRAHSILAYLASAEGDCPQPRAHALLSHPFSLHPPPTHLTPAYGAPVARQTLPCSSPGADCEDGPVAVSFCNARGPNQSEKSNSMQGQSQRVRQTCGPPVAR